MGHVNQSLKSLVLDSCRHFLPPTFTEVQDHEDEVTNESAIEPMTPLMALASSSLRPLRALGTPSTQMPIT